jgi:hypothetical protein
VRSLACIHSGDARKLLDEVAAARERALALIATHKGGPFSWPLDSFGGRLGYWLHVGIVQAWNEEDRRTPYAEFAARWLASDTNVLLALLAVERSDYVDARDLLRLWLMATDAATLALVARDTRHVLKDEEGLDHA